MRAPLAAKPLPPKAAPRFSVSQAPAATRDPSVSTAIALPWRLRLLEAIADAIERLDHIETLIGLLELLAQALDVAVDGAVVDIDLVVVGRIHQRVAGLHHARAGGERLQDQEFRHRQHHRMVVPMAGVPFRVETQFAPL